VTVNRWNKLPVERRRDRLWFDVTDTIGWAMGSVVVLFARPIAWAIFSDHHMPRLRRA